MNIIAATAATSPAGKLPWTSRPLTAPEVGKTLGAVVPEGTAATVDWLADSVTMVVGGLAVGPA